MAYTLGSTTLPSPQEFSRQVVETAKAVTTLDGTLKKDIVNRKERFVLTYRNITPAQAASILSEYSDQAVKSFAVAETNLTIAATNVHIDVAEREYVKGGSYRENLILVLTEVS